MWFHHRYQPSNCDSCSSCGSDAGVLGASTCSSCSSGSVENVSMHTNLGPTQAMQTQSTQAQAKRSNQSSRGVATENDSIRTQPTPAARPHRAAPPEQRSMPVPDPIPNAMIRYPSQNGLSVGSGTSIKGTSVASQHVMNAKRSASH
jgi:hypothetical protein